MITLATVSVLALMIGFIIGMVYKEYFKGSYGSFFKEIFKTPESRKKLMDSLDYLYKKYSSYFSGKELQAIALDLIYSLADGKITIDEAVRLLSYILSTVFSGSVFVQKDVEAIDPTVKSLVQNIVAKYFNKE